MSTLLKIACLALLTLLVQPALPSLAQNASQTGQPDWATEVGRRMNALKNFLGNNRRQLQSGSLQFTVEDGNETKTKTFVFNFTDTDGATQNDGMSDGTLQLCDVRTSEPSDFGLPKIDQTQMTYCIEAAGAEVPPGALFIAACAGEPIYHLGSSYLQECIRNRGPIGCGYYAFFYSNPNQWYSYMPTTCRR